MINFVKKHYIKGKVTVNDRKYKTGYKFFGISDVDAE